ncbi:MAG: SGNH/GDSL hydrolase family protein, partial [Lentisphaeria bacterium]
ETVEINSKASEVASAGSAATATTKAGESAASAAAALASEQAAAEHEETTLGYKNATIAAVGGATDLAEIIESRKGKATLGEKIGEIDSQLAEKATTIDIDAISGQIDNLILNAGDGTLPSEVVDMRANSKGKTYITAGENVKSIDEKVDDALFQAVNTISNPDFLIDTSGWGAMYSTLLASNNKLEVTSTGVATTARAGQMTYKKLVVGHKYYVKSVFTPKLKLPEFVELSLRSGGIGGSTVASVKIATGLTLDTPVTLSGVVVNPSRTDGESPVIIATYADIATSNGAKYTIEYPMIIDLTEAYGLGKEPSLSEFETWLSANFSNSWFKNSKQVSKIRDIYYKSQDKIIINSGNIKENAVLGIHTDFINLNSNIFNRFSDENIIGQFCAPSGSLVNQSDTAISHKIQVAAGDIIRFLDVPLFLTTFKGAMFDVNDKQIGVVSTSTTNLTAVNSICQFTVPANTDYIKINYRPSSALFMITKNADYPSRFIPYQLTINDTINVNQSNVIGYYIELFNKALCIGDSLTQGAYYGDGAMRIISENYPHYLEKLTKWTVENAGGSGYTATTWWTNRGAMYTYANYDVFIICLGTNEGLTDTLTPDTATTPYQNYANTNTGNYCKIIESILAGNPLASIFLTNIYASSGDLEITNNVINQISAKYELPVIDINDGRLYGEGSELLHPGGNSVHFGKIGNLIFAKHILGEMTKAVEDNPVKYDVPID